LESIEKVVFGLEISYEILFEKMMPSMSETPSLPAQCYELVDALPSKEQQVVLDMVRKMVEYKKI